MGVPSRDSAEERLQLSVMQIRADLFAWYRQWKADHPDKPLTELQDLVPTMLGTAPHPLCKTKGGETKGLLLYTTDLVR
eukprot:14179265-Alexandrium_andersonii.AAC.1